MMKMPFLGIPVKKIVGPAILLGLLLSSLSMARADTLWLGDLDLSKMSVGWGKPAANRSVEGHTLSIGGEPFERGVGTHAVSVLHIELNGRAESFSAWVGVDDEVKGHVGSVRFQIFGDEQKLFDSGVQKAGQKAQRVEVDLAGVKRVVLYVGAAGDGINYDHADWAEARFEFAGERPRAVDAPKEEAVLLTPKPGPMPRINGPPVYGARPGNPFLYRIPTAGERPMTFSTRDLPDSLALDPQTGIISGYTPARPGDYPVVLIAKNAVGRAERAFTIVAGETLTLTPPMGWNSWNVHYNRVTDLDMRAAADAMVASGMADHGYQYIDIDDCWARKEGDAPYRDEDGAVLPNDCFPDMAALTEYIHAKGLKAGIYTSPGPWTCAGYTGSFDHEQKDAETFACWGFDFLKYDWCSYGQKAKDASREELMKPYRKMGAILRGVGRDIVFNLCQYGMGAVWEWGGQVGGNSWRTTGDVGLLSGFMEGGLSNARHFAYAKPGQWNDPDYILIGWVGDARGMGQGTPTTITPNEQYAYMSMWCLMAAPLFFSGDLNKLDAFTLNVLCNDEVIEVDQDVLGKQGRIVEEQEDFFVMVKEMVDGSRAVGFFNTTEVAVDIAVTWEQLGIGDGLRVRDLWQQRDEGIFKEGYSARVGRRGVKMIRCFFEGP